MLAPARAKPIRAVLGVALLVPLLVAAPASAKTDTIATVAGTGANGYSGDGGPATAAQLSVPVEVESTPDGGYLIVEQGSVHVRRVAPDGTITTIAGNGTTGFSGDNGPATAASLATPNGVAVRADGGILIADSANNRVRLVAPNGTITTVAGTGTPGYNGDSIAATAAQLSFPAGLAVTADGGFLIADNDNNRIRRVGPDGIITTVAGTGAAGSGGDGGLATSAQINDPGGVEVLADGSFALTEVVGARVRLVAPNGVISTVAGTGVAGGGGDGAPAVNAQLSAPIGIAAVPGGGLLIADSGNHRVRLVGADGIIRTVAGTGTAGPGGDGGLATAAQLSSPIGVALASDGDYLVADASNQRVRRVDAGDPGVPPPPPVPVRNVTAPSISGVGINRKVHYPCDPGTWEGLPVPPAFEFSWWRGHPFLQLAGQKPKAPTLLANGESYLPKAADIGQLIYCHVRVRDGRGVLHEASSFPTVLSGSAAIPPVLRQRYGNVRIRGIDVFQVVQPASGATIYGYPMGSFPEVCGAGTSTAYEYPCTTSVPAEPQRVPYLGVILDARKAATAVVYVDMADVATPFPQQELVVTLRAWIGGRQVADAVVKRVRNPPVSTTPWVTFVERDDERRFGVNIPVPDAWLRAAANTRFDLEATVSLPVGAGGGALEECSLLVAGPSCYDDDTFRLERVHVEGGLPDLNIRTVALLTKGQSISGPDALAPPQQVLADGLALIPGGARVRVQPYATTIDISSVTTLDATSEECEPFLALTDPLRPCRVAVVARALTSFLLTDAPDRTAYDVLMGVQRYPGEPGWSSGSIDTAAVIAVDDGANGQPLTGTAHELGHVLGLGHIGPKCTANGDDWDPDDEGRLQGWKFRAVVTGVSVVYQRLPDIDLVPIHDLMSYCARSDAYAWLSARSWNRLLVNLLGVEARRRSRPPAAARRLTAATAAYATGYVTPTGGFIDAVRPGGTEARLPAPDPASPYSLRSVDASGATLAEVGIALTPVADGDGTSTFAVAIPDGAAAVELRVGDTLLARRARSQPPTVRILAPAGSVRVAPSSALTVRWSASDPDGDELRVTIEHAANGRSGWRTVFAGPSTGRASIPGRYLEPGRAARLRVTVSDGFGSTSAISAPFRAEGRAPSVTIVTPEAAAEQQAGIRAVLAGTASDATGAPLRGAALTWFAGTRRLGTGERLLVRLPAGRTTLRLRARDAGGRASVATRTVTVVAPPLLLTTLRPPVRVKPGARTAQVRVATSRAALLQAGGRTFRVGPKARTLAIRLPASPNAGALRIRIRVGDGARRPEIDETMVVLRV